MNVLFVYSYHDIQSSSKPLKLRTQTQFGISYISALLKKNGHKTRLIVLSRKLGRKNRNRVDKCVEDFCPQLICFTTVYSEYEFIASIAKYVRGKYPAIFLLIGGPHVSLNPEKVLVSDFDALCIGEGEYPTLELVAQLEMGVVPSGIKNLWLKRVGSVEKNSTRPFLAELDELPFPDREMWQEWIEEPRHSLMSILLGRGCPFQCTFCCNHTLKKIAPGRYVRFRSPANIVKEIIETLDRFPSQETLFLEVETIGLDLDWLLALCSKIEQLNETLKHPLSFGTNLRIVPNMDLDTLFSAFQKGNFKFILIGLESGSERIRREILNRNYSNDDIFKAVTLARKRGMKVTFNNLIGIPYETVSNFRETVKMNRRCLPDSHSTSIFFPYPGTDLYSLCKENNLLPESINTDMERNKAILDLPGFNKKQIQKSFTWFDYYVYKNIKPLHEIIIKVAIAKIKSYSYLVFIVRRFLISLDTIFKRK